MSRWKHEQLLRRADGTSTGEELARLEALGARRVDVGQGPEVSWTVLADDEGNEFCLLSRTVEEAASSRAWIHRADAVDPERTEHRTAPAVSHTRGLDHTR